MSTVLEKCATGRAGNPPGQGPFLHLTIRVAGGVILDASYETYACPGCHACGKAICRLIAGKNIVDASAITHPTLVERVGPLERHRQICYGLALLALADALKQIKPMAMQEDP